MRKHSSGFPLARLASGLAAMVLLIGCGTAEPAKTPVVKLEGERLVLERGASVLSGAFAQDGSRIEFWSEALSPQSTRLFVTVNGKRFDFNVDFA